METPGEHFLLVFPDVVLLPDQQERDCRAVGHKIFVCGHGNLKVRAEVTHQPEAVLSVRRRKWFPDGLKCMKKYFIN